MILSLGIGLLGLGRHGRRYAEHLAAGDVPGARLVALWRRDRAAGRRDAARYGIELTDTPRMLCRLPEVNVVVSSCRRGCTRDSSMVAHALRFDPRVVALRRLVRRLGTVRAVTCLQRLENASRDGARGAIGELRARSGAQSRPRRGGRVRPLALSGSGFLRSLAAGTLGRLDAGRPPLATDVTATRTEPLMRPGHYGFAALSLLGLALALSGCAAEPEPDIETERLLARYATVSLTADLSALSPAEREMLPLLIAAADQMDAVFWQQAFGNRDSLLASIDDPALRRYAEINYGPWDRLDGDRPFLPGVGPKPAGAGFYPPDISKAEFEAVAARDTTLKSLYTLVRRAPDGSLTSVPYHEAYPMETRAAAEKLREAAALAADSGLRRYLELRAVALLSDDYRASDLAWLDMKTNTIEVVIGPIETYEDQLFGYKAAHEAYILVKDHDWSRRLERYATFLTDLQRGLPVPDRYKRERPGTEGDLNAYDAIYYAGHANAGSKTIAINLPNDEEVQLRKGTRRLQLKNAMRAKFDNILVPIAGVLIAPDQRAHVSFDAFFANTMFHEVAHGLGIKNTVTGRGTVRETLQAHASAMEEGKADVLGLYMVTALADRGELEGADLRDYYVTFLAGIFRSVRFGASSAHGRANMVRFNVFEEAGAFSREEDGTYRVNIERMREAVASLARRLLVIQGDGDADAAGALLAEKGVIGPGLQADLDRLDTLAIPIDIVFRQGMAVLQ